MNKQNIEQYVLKMLQEYSEQPIEECTPDMSLLDDFCFSSVELLALINDVECEYKIHISSRELNRIATVNDLTEVIYKHFSA